MSYKHRIAQPHRTKPRVQPHVAKKIGAMLLTALPIFAVFGTTTLLTGCGFHLRGYDTPLRFDSAKTALIIEDNRTSFPLKLPLTRRLEALGVDVVDSVSLDIIDNNQTDSTASRINTEQVATIAVNNVRFKRYELVGVLTEIRLVLSADVTYETVQNGQPVTLTNPIQVERSYQYNEASVSTDDQQGTQIRDWLYNSLARRITDQYVAISLPKVASASVSALPQSSIDAVIEPATISIIAPNP